MKAIQIVLEEPLLRAVDKEARRSKVNRSALVREALREHLGRRRIHELEQRDRAGYQKSPATEFAPWHRLASWPDE